VVGFYFWRTFQIYLDKDIKNNNRNATPLAERRFLGCKGPKKRLGEANPSSPTLNIKALDIAWLLFYFSICIEFAYNPIRYNTLVYPC